MKSHARRTVSPDASGIAVQHRPQVDKGSLVLTAGPVDLGAGQRNEDERQCHQRRFEIVLAAGRRGIVTKLAAPEVLLDEPEPVIGLRRQDADDRQRIELTLEVQLSRRIGEVQGGELLEREQGTALPQPGPQRPKEHLVLVKVRNQLVQPGAERTGAEVDQVVLAEVVADRRLTGVIRGLRHGVVPAVERGVPALPELERLEPGHRGADEHEPAVRKARVRLTRIAGRLSHCRDLALHVVQHVHRMEIAVVGVEVLRVGELGRARLCSGDGECRRRASRGLRLQNRLDDRPDPLVLRDLSCERVGRLVIAGDDGVASEGVEFLRVAGIRRRGCLANSRAESRSIARAGKCCGGLFQSRAIGDHGHCNIS